MGSHPTSYYTTEGFSAIMTSEPSLTPLDLVTTSTLLLAITPLNLRELLVSMTPQRLIDFFLEDQVLHKLRPVMATMDSLLPPRSSQMVTPLLRPTSSFLGHHPSLVNINKLLLLSFGKLSLGVDYLAFISNFTAVEDAYQASEAYKVLQYSTFLLCDAQDLFESCLSHITPPTWTYNQ